MGGIHLPSEACCPATPRAPPAAQGCMKSGQVLTDKRWKWYEPEYWRFGDPAGQDGRINYMRHASGGRAASLKPLLWRCVVPGLGWAGPPASRPRCGAKGACRQHGAPAHQAHEAACWLPLLPTAGCPAKARLASRPPPRRPAVRRVAGGGALHWPERAGAAPLCQRGRHAGGLAGERVPLSSARRPPEHRKLALPSPLCYKTQQGPKRS